MNNFHLESLDALGLLAIFTYSFLVSLHCLGMCGPLACSLIARSRVPAWQSALLYNSGRALSYTSMGALSGAITLSVVQLVPEAARIISLVFGGIMVASATFLLFNRRDLLQKIPSIALGSWWTKLQNKVQGRFAVFLLGLMTVFLPCMTLHPLLLMSASTQSPWNGALAMFAFFLGTLPAMFSATYMPTLISERLFPIWLKKLGPVVLLAAGVITMLRGMA